MKRLLFLTLTIATVALLGGCVETDDYGHEDTNHHDSDHSQIMDSAPAPNGGY